jgi:Formate/nitrite family of transporters
MKYGALVTMLHAVYAGWLIALMVWMLPGAETSKPLVIIVMTYIVGLAGFAHVVAGSIECSTRSRTATRRLSARSSATSSRPSSATSLVVSRWSRH